LYGIAYSPDPVTPFARYSRDELAVDFLQFPRETLSYKAGDCDDLSVLYCALLESLAIETAFITIPGHIFIAFALDTPPEKIERTLLPPDDLVIHSGKTWVPIEITKIQAPFLEAWQTGAKEWREYLRVGQASFYPTRESWMKYEPVGIPGFREEIDLPEESLVSEAFREQITQFVSREIYPKVAKLNELIENDPGEVKYANRLGVLYAQHGLTEKAAARFRSILEQKEYAPALINLGNLFCLEKDWEAALEYYQRAEQVEPEKPVVLLGIARAHHELQNFGFAKKYFEALKSINPELADRYGYLEYGSHSSTREASPRFREETVEWDED
jgi:hypothetical protein